jgi:hypothetical protein
MRPQTDQREPRRPTIDELETQEIRQQLVVSPWIVMTTLSGACDARP